MDDNHAAGPPDDVSDDHAGDHPDDPHVGVSDDPADSPADLAAARRRRRHAQATALAADQDGVVSRPQLYALGLTRGEVRAQVRAQRWQRRGTHCLTVHAGPLSDAAEHWIAVLEGGPRAMIDGASALILAGLEHYTVDEIRVSVPRGARIRHRGSHYDIRQTRRLAVDDAAVSSGPPRTRPAVAAVRAALWARSARQGQLVLMMTVQQGLATPEQLAEEALRVRRDRRRPLLGEVILELMGGVRSLNELDVVRGCRERGLPEPDKQVCRRNDTGTYFLDFRWRDWGVVVEVDGIQHAWVTNIVEDALRHNGLAIDGDTVLHLPVLGLRARPDEFYRQIEDALRAKGWSRDEPDSA